MNVASAYMLKLWIAPAIVIQTSDGVRRSTSAEPGRRRAPMACGSEAPRSGSGKARQSTPATTPGSPARRNAVRQPHACATAPPTA